MTVPPTLLPGAPLHPPTAPEKLRRVSLNEESNYYCGLWGVICSVCNFVIFDNSRKREKFKRRIKISANKVHH